MVSKTVLFLSQTQFSPSLKEQRDECAKEGDVVLDASDVRFTNLLSGTSRHGATLRAGDHLKFYDLNSFPFPQATLVRMMVKVLRAGVSIEIHKENLSISPDPTDGFHIFLKMLDNQQRALHAIKTHGPDVSPGRKHAIHDKEWPEIRALLEAKMPSQQIATRYGVGRTTLFNFIRRMRAPGGSQEK